MNVSAISPRKLPLAGGVVLVIIILVAAGWFIIRSRSATIPKSIANKISFVVLWPTDEAAKPIHNTVKYDAQQSVLSFDVLVGNTKLVVTEQATPSEFADIPNYYSALVTHLNNYDTFNSANGTIYLTEPSNTAGQVAVDNDKGTLLFVHALGKLSENTWRTFFNNSKIILN